MNPLSTRKVDRCIWSIYIYSIFRNSIQLNLLHNIKSPSRAHSSPTQRALGQSKSLLTSLSSPLFLLQNTHSYWHHNLYAYKCSICPKSRLWATINRNMSSKLTYQNDASSSTRTFVYILVYAEERMYIYVYKQIAHGNIYEKVFFVCVSYWLRTYKTGTLDASGRSRRIYNWTDGPYMINVIAHIFV